MRLICPRCGAQYEVDDVIIPAAGRDVQCSGCGQTWFQPSRQMLDRAQEKPVDADGGLEDWDITEPAASASAVAPATAPDPVAPPEQEPEPEPWPEPLPEDWPEFEEDPEPAPPPAGPRPVEAEPAEALDWSVPPVETAPAPPAPDATPTPDVSEAIAELMRRHPFAMAEPRVPTTASAPSVVPVPPPIEPPETDPSADVGPAPRAGAVPRRALDENLLSILREEAEREAAARRAEGAVIETQQEMNLDPVLAPPASRTVAPVTPDAPRAKAPPPAPETPPAAPKVMPVRPEPPRRVPDFSDLNSEEDEDRHADLTEGPESEETPRPGRFTRRQRLPDIDEINSSLRASADRAGDIAAMGARRESREPRSGFRLGFFSVILVAVLAANVYAYASTLASAVPALAPMLDSYVTAVDAARAWLDAQLRSVIAEVQAGAPPQG